jgi:prolycopene isomerase
VPWPSFSETVEFFDQGAWKDVAELIQLSQEDKRIFSHVLGRMASLSDEEISEMDALSWEDWMDRAGLPEPVRRLLSALSMIMTTLSHPSEQAAGEVLYIARENLQKKRQVLSANYPDGGMAAITNPLQEAVKAGGGEIVTGCEVQEVIIENNAAKGVRIPHRAHASPYPPEYRVLETERVLADIVVLALPSYHLHRVLDLHPSRTALPSWWIRWIRETSTEITGLVGYILGLREPVSQKRCFFSALTLPNTGLPFQAFPASTYDPSCAPEGKQLLHTDCVIDYDDVRNPFTVRRKLEAMWKDLDLLFPGFEGKLEWRLPYKTVGCDGLARKPGLVGNYKPDVEAPGVRGLFFAGDTYRGRGLAMNGAARSAMLCADRIQERLSQGE